MSREQKLAESAARASEFATRLDNLMHLVDHNGSTALGRLSDAAAGLKAIATDGGGGGATPWCEAHEREVEQCHERCVAHDVPISRCRSLGSACHLVHPCVGVPVQSHDPTGETAIRASEALASLKAVERLVLHGEKALRAALTALEPWSPRPPSEAERQSLHVENTPGCESCARVEVAKGVRRWEPPHPNVKGPTDVGGRLARDQILCRWCYDHTGTRGCLPSLDELRQHHAGGRVDCRHPVQDDWRAASKKGKPTRKGKATSKSAPERQPSRAARAAARTQRRAAGHVGGAAS